jgi:hypothetical protein
MNITKFIKVYQEVFTEDFCKTMTRRTDSNELESVEYSKNPNDNYNCNAIIQSNKTVKFYDGHPKGTVENISLFMFKRIDIAIKHYIQNLGYENPFHPTRYTYEAITLSRYLNNDKDEYGLHIASDCVCSSSKTLMVIGLLNNVEEGGEISFPDFDVDIKLDLGSILIFPSNWMFPFKINKPISNPQYIFNTFTHFADSCNQPDICLHPIHKKTS